VKRGREGLRKWRPAESRPFWTRPASECGSEGFRGGRGGPRRGIRFFYFRFLPAAYSVKKGGEGRKERPMFWSEGRPFLSSSAGRFFLVEKERGGGRKKKKGIEGRDCPDDSVAGQELSAFLIALQSKHPPGNERGKGGEGKRGGSLIRRGQQRRVFPGTSNFSQDTVARQKPQNNLKNRAEPTRSNRRGKGTPGLISKFAVGPEDFGQEKERERGEK